MSERRLYRRRLTSVLLLVACVDATMPTNVSAIDFKKTAIKIAVCGGGAYGGYKLGDKLADLEAKKLKLAGAEAEKHRRAIQIGMAAALCGTGVYLTGTVYGTLSKRDREARDKEMAAALADVNPGSRSYVLPDSGYKGRLQTDVAEMDGNRECRTQVDFLAKEDEPARTRWCRNSPKDKYELDI